MAGNEITVVGDKGIVNWIAAASRTSEVYMKDVETMVANVLVKAGKAPITRLTVIDPGGPRQQPRRRRDVREGPGQRLHVREV